MVLLSISGDDFELAYWARFNPIPQKSTHPLKLTEKKDLTELEKDVDLEGHFDFEVHPKETSEFKVLTIKTKEWNTTR